MIGTMKERLEKELEAIQKLYNKIQQAQSEFGLDYYGTTVYKYSEFALAECRVRAKAITVELEKIK